MLPLVIFMAFNIIFSEAQATGKRFFFIYSDIVMFPSIDHWRRTLWITFLLFDIVYTSLGCWEDKSDRSIPTLEGSSTLLDGSYQNRVDAIQKCYQVAKSLGYEVFAVQNGGWCASSCTAKSTYKTYGTSTACMADGEGGPWANHVYEITHGTLLI